MISDQDLIGIPHYEITQIDKNGGEVRIAAKYTGPRSCPDCSSIRLRNKGVITRTVRHTSWAAERVWLVLSGHRWKCYDCGRQFRERFPGIFQAQRATEAYRGHVFRDHWDGINRSRVATREGIGHATVERYCLHFLERLGCRAERKRRSSSARHRRAFLFPQAGLCHHLVRPENHRVFDVVLGRSEASLEDYLNRLLGKEHVRVVCMDLAPSYRALARKHFPRARIVADRFHVIRLVNHHFLSCWRELDSAGSKNRGLVSLMRRHRHNLSPEQSFRLASYLRGHPALELIYRFKQRLCYLLLKKHRTRKQCEQLIPRFLRAVYQLKHAILPQLVALGETLETWSQEIVAMWRFTRNNGITEGFHTKMEVLQRQAYGFRNFQKIACGLRYRVLKSATTREVPPFSA